VPASHEIIEFGPFRLKASERLLQRDGAVVEIGSRSLDVLVVLVERAGEVISQRELIARAWSGLVVDEANLRVNIANLRKTLRDGQGGARYIVNVPGRGYSFVAPVTRVKVESSPPNPAPQVSRAAVSGTAPQVRQALASTTAAAPGELPGQSLPERPARLIGRDETIRALTERLTKDRFVSLVGPGGMGKTTVAICVAHEVREAFGGAVYFVDLGSLTDAALIPGTIAAVLGLRIPSSDPMPGVLEFLAHRRALLVLDNCEHLIEQAADTAERLYKSAPHTHVLATSREALRVEGEHVHVLTPLDGPPPTGELTAADAMTFPAVQLFMERAAAGGAREPLTNEEAAIAGEICRRMDGIALAIELAASRVRSHGVRGTAELLHSRFNLLWQGRRSALPRHQTLQATLDWSYNLLSASDRRVLDRLAVFVGPFELAAAQRVAVDAALDEACVTAAVESLIDKSLLSTSTLGGSSYLRLLDTTRTYALAKLTESGELNAVTRKLAEYLVADLSLREDNAEAGRADRHAAQIGHIRAALAWTFGEAGDKRLGVRLTALAAPIFLEKSLLQDCHHWCDLALQHLGEDAGSRTHLALQEALAISAMFTRGNGADVREAIEHGLRLAQAFGDRQRELALLAGLHIFMTRVGDFEGAVEVGRRSIELARAIDSAAGIVMSEWMLGCAFHLIGDREGAVRHTEEGFKQAAASGVTKVDLFGYGHRTRALIVLARSLWLGGAVDRAAQVARQAVEETEQGDQPINRCIALLYSATVFIWRGDADEAGTLVSRLIQHAARYSLGPYRAVGIALSGEVALLKGEPRVAVERIREALEILHAEKHHVLTTTISRAMAEALLRCERIVDAEATITAALDRAEAQRSPFDMPDLMRTRVQIGLVSGRLDTAAAEEMLLRSIDLARKQGARSLELRSTMALGELLAREGRVAGAHAMLSEVYGHFTEGLETRDLRHARQLLGTWRSDAGVSRMGAAEPGPR
jgi:predicted ATPase/DNA-binding winged helix-turn-helix (wHTH) protein